MTEQEKLWGFISATGIFTAVFIAAGMPIPLYNIYVSNLGLDKSTLSLTAVMYFLGTVIALMFFARLSNYWGRKPVIYITIALGLGGCGLLLNVDAAWRLMLGRLLQGLSCGMASSTVTAFIVDNEPEKYKGWSSALIGSMTNVGLVAGALVVGLLNFFFDSLSIGFILSGAILLAGVYMMLRCRETMPYRSGVLHSLIPQVRLTPKIKKYLPASACAFAGSWAVGGFYQAFSSAIAVQQFGIQNTFVASLVLVSFIMPIAFGAIFARGRDSFAVQRWGMTLFVASMFSVLASFHCRSIIPFLLVNIVAGAAEGATFTASMSCILNQTSLADRAGVLSVIYIISYGGAVVPSIFVSYIADGFTLYELTAGYVVLVSAAWILMLLTGHKE